MFLTTAFRPQPQSLSQSVAGASSQPQDLLPTRETRPLTRPRRSRFMPHPQASSQAGAGSAAGASSQPQELHPMLPTRDTRPLTRPRRSRFMPHPQASSQAGAGSAAGASSQPQELLPKLPTRETRPLTRPRRSRFMPHPASIFTGWFLIATGIATTREDSAREKFATAVDSFFAGRLRFGTCVLFAATAEYFSEH